MCTAHHDIAQAKEEKYELLRNKANFLAVKSIIYNRTLFFNCLPLSAITQRVRLINHNMGVTKKEFMSKQLKAIKS